MMTFFLFGKYTPESIQKISLKRTEQIVNEIKGLGGVVNAMHVLLGEDDLLLCVQLPGMEEAIKASVNLTRLSGISFKTLPAVSVEKFDQLTAIDRR